MSHHCLYKSNPQLKWNVSTKRTICPLYERSQFYAKRKILFTVHCGWSITDFLNIDLTVANGIHRLKPKGPDTLGQKFYWFTYFFLHWKEFFVYDILQTMTSDDGYLWWSKCCRLVILGCDSSPLPLSAEVPGRDSELKATQMEPSTQSQNLPENTCLRETWMTICETNRDLIWLPETGCWYDGYKDVDVYIVN